MFKIFSGISNLNLRINSTEINQFCAQFTQKRKTLKLLKTLGVLKDMK